MENNPIPQTTATGQHYAYAANLLVNDKNTFDVKMDLIAQGLSESDADSIISGIEMQITDAKKDRAKKDMLYGALWCIGGTVLTIANVGFIFWGAIIFGGIQFFKGLLNSAKY